VEHFNAGVDRFSEIVIYLALSALSLKPDLLGRYETGGEGLLFQRDDFLDPYTSKVLQEMENLPGMRSLIYQFRHICTSEISRVPRLADFLISRPVDLPRREKVVATPPPFPVVDARLRYRLLSRVGKQVTVVGKVMDIFRGTSPDGQPHIFLNFGHWRVKCFTIVIWNDALQLLQESGKTAEDYLHQWVSVTGMLTEYERRPQIVITAPGDVQLLADEMDALRIIGNPLPAVNAQPAAKQEPAVEIKPVNLPETEPAPVENQMLRNLDQSLEILARVEKLFGK
jgi:hypothetical protein